jgi:hypothetical protein
MKDPTPYTLVYSTALQQGKVDYEKETLEISGVTLYLTANYSWFRIPEKVVNEVQKGLTATGRTRDWGLNWPAKSVAATSPFVSKTDRLTVAVQLLNDKGRVIGRQNVTLSYGWTAGFLRESGALSVTPDEKPCDVKEVRFPAVKADEVTDKLNINIASINGENAQTASKNKRISIMPLDEYANTKKGIYAIGDLGPAGGIVFYADGGRYLEAAPQSSETKLNWNDAKTYCDSLNIGGYSDWHLPDRRELDLMYKNLKTKGLGGFSNSWYWSSSEINDDGAWFQNFDNGDQDPNLKNYPVSVRAVRAF